MGRLPESRIGETVLVAVRLSGVDLDLLTCWMKPSATGRQRSILPRSTTGSWLAGSRCCSTRPNWRESALGRFGQIISAHAVNIKTRHTGCPATGCPEWCLLAGTTEDWVVGVGVDLENEVSAGFDGFEAVAMTASERDLHGGVVLWQPHESRADVSLRRMSGQTPKEESV